MSGLTDIPTFMSLLYVGYREYAEVRILVDIVPWFIESGAVPVFMVTHAIWPSSRDICQD